MTRHSSGSLLFFVLAGCLLSPIAVFAHGDEEHKEKKAIDYSKAAEHVFGKAADPANAVRTIRVEMSDQMRFRPDVIEVQAGEVVRLDIRNQGKILHELVLGTTEELEEHAALMKKFPGMEHEEPHMAHVKPGKTGEIGWRFTQAGEYHFGCLLPGHFDAGMKGRILVR